MRFLVQASWVSLTNLSVAMSTQALLIADGTRDSQAENRIAGTDYDSLQGTTNFREFLVYDNSLVYPEYIMFYKSGESEVCCCCLFIIALIAGLYFFTTDDESGDEGSRRLVAMKALGALWR